MYIYIYIYTYMTLKYSKLKLLIVNPHYNNSLYENTIQTCSAWTSSNDMYIYIYREREREKDMLLVCLRFGVATLKLWHLWFISVSQSTKLRMIFVEAQHVSGSIGHILSLGCQNRCLETKRGDCESDAEFSWSLQFGGSSEVLLVWSGQIIPTWP